MGYRVGRWNGGGSRRCPGGALRRRCPTAAAEASRIVGIYLGHSLLEAAPAEAGATPLPAGEAGDRPFVTGWVDSYGDMKELLLLDPVHDLDGNAWPPAPPRAGA